MNASERKKILQKLTARVSTGLLFVQLNYLDLHQTPDSAWIRNIYILLSFYTELLLKAVYVCEKNPVSLKDLDKKLRAQGHDLSSIGNQIGKERLLKYGIKEIKKMKDHEYRMVTNIGSFFVKDFNDIRYDFLDDRVRVLKGD